MPLATERGASLAINRLQGEVALSGIYEVSKILAKPARLETTLSNVLNLLSSYLDMRQGTIMLLDDDDVPEIVVGSCWSEDLSHADAASIPRQALDQIIATAMPLIVENAESHPLFAAQLADGSLKHQSFIGVPIKIEDRVVGTISIDRPSGGASSAGFDPDVRFLSMIANLIGQTIHLHRVIARDRQRLLDESRRLEKQLATSAPAKIGKSKADAHGIVGESPQIRAVLDKIAIVAKSNATVLLRGESGTGKELFARAIHELSPRAKGPFVKVNCAALPESVLESELFGHEKGAFTGAVNARQGRFELADGGTIFLDEIGEISPSFQAKLLRVLQEGEFDRVGSTKTQKVKVRVVAATNKDLEQAVTAGTFRADLYYRISVVPLMLPALRERKSDIPALAQSFLSRFNKENGRDLQLTKGALDVLKACYFPGNVRELENCIVRTATLARGPAIEGIDFACGHGECLSSVLWHSKSHAPANRAPATMIPLPVTPSQAAEPDDAHSCACGSPVPGEGDCTTPDVCGTQGIRVSRAQLIDAMERCGWVQAKAARILRLTPRQIGYALKKHNVDVKKF
ncbi:MAG: nif-specific transcriptional activator NifA [Hyphomicrobiaceae bacterium]|nr:nif-specific transcriptional activator NifA [Hyphomicrobiaceae bacterium]